MEDRDPGGTHMPASLQEANSGTTPVRDGYRFDEAGLDRWMRASVADYGGPLTAEQFRGGESKPTSRLIYPRRCYSLGRKPPGPLLKGAPPVERGAGGPSALGTGSFPVAPR